LEGYGLFAPLDHKLLYKTSNPSKLKEYHGPRKDTLLEPPMAEFWQLTNALLYNLLWNIWWELLVLWEGGGGGWWWYPLATHTHTHTHTLSLSLSLSCNLVLEYFDPTKESCVWILLKLSVVTSQALCKWAIPSTPHFHYPNGNMKNLYPCKKHGICFFAALPSYTHSLTQGSLVTWWHENWWTW
jgi:hypothetical protein